MNRYQQLMQKFLGFAFILELTSDETWLYTSNDPYIFPFSMMAVLFPIMSILIAISLWRNRLMSRWIPELFIAASISFFYSRRLYGTDDVSHTRVYLAGSFSSARLAHLNRRYG
jgi:hypothetical protein